MDILKIGVLAALLHGAVHAEFFEVVDGPPSSIKQICEGITERGNTVWEYFDEMKTLTKHNDFKNNSANWYITANIDVVLNNIRNHSSISPFLKYNYREDNIESIELLLNKNTYIPNTMLQKAFSLLNNINHIAMPMKKLPISTQQKYNLFSLFAPGLKHINRNAFFYDYDNSCNIYSINLPSAESIGTQAFYYNLGFITLSDSLKFLGYYPFVYCQKIHLACIPHFTHFLAEAIFGDSYYLESLSIADPLRYDRAALRTSAEILNITCYGRIANLKKVLEQIEDSSRTSRIKDINIKVSDSIKDIVTVDYIKDILEMEKSELLLRYMGANKRCFFDFSNTQIPEDKIRSLASVSIDNSIPWILSFPHISMVNGDFNTLFRQLHGIILSDAEFVTANAFAGVFPYASSESSETAILGFCDTVTFENNALAGLAPTALEITVSRPKKIMPFISALKSAGLDFSKILKFIIKFPGMMAQSPSIGLYVASLLAALPPPPENSQNSGLFSSNRILYFDLQNSNLTDIFSLPIAELSREYSCVFTLPDGYYHFLQSNNATELETNAIEGQYLIKTAILSERLKTIPRLAFYSTSLTFITIPNSVTNIEEDTFERTPLASVVIPDSVTTIGLNAFAESALTNIIFSEKSQLQNIGDGAFCCTPLAYVTIPNSVTKIGSYIFFDTRLTSITIPDSVTTISSSAFADCSIQQIKINCCTEEENHIITTLNNDIPRNIHTLKVALSSSLLATKSPEGLKTYVAGILALNPPDNATINAILEKHGTFELDLSNTTLTPSGISGMPELLPTALPWQVIFANGERVAYG